MGEVARLAGVSHQTVSRVLNGHVNVSRPDPRAGVEAMRELDYRPNHAAKSLVTGRSSTLGVVTPRSSGLCLHAGRGGDAQHRDRLGTP